jgi:septum formation protein
LRLVLASQSPRRREILERAGFEFTVRVAAVPERPEPGESPVQYVIRLSRSKAEAVTRDADEVVLGADTVVVLGEHILEKPCDARDAARMLRMLSGRTHNVITGICLAADGTLVQDHAETRVHFTHLGDEDIARYVESGEPMDKAGAYAIQGLASKFIDGIEGCYFNVVGLPVALVYKQLSLLCLGPGLHPLRTRG